MLKLLVVTPNPTVYDATVRIVQTTKFDAEVIQTTSRQVVEDVSKAMEAAQALSLRCGNQAQLLKKHVEYPVSEITFSGQEMAGFVKQACDLIPHKHPKIAFVGFRHMYSDVENIGALANADVRVYYAGRLGHGRAGDAECHPGRRGSHHRQRKRLQLCRGAGDYDGVR